MTPDPELRTLAVVLAQPGSLSLQTLALNPPGEEDVVVDIDFSGISTGTERLLWSGRMPMFPGMGYPLVPGYESVGRVVQAGPRASRAVGERVFVPGARCFGPVHGLFGGAASRLVVPGHRVVPVGEASAEEGVLLALAATAHHAVSAPGAVLPELIVGHGALGRLMARLCVAAGSDSVVVWERDPERAKGAQGYRVMDPAEDPRRDYRAIYDVSGDASLLDTLVSRLAPGGEIVLAGFYTERLQLDFVPAFMREARLRVAAQWSEPDMQAVRQMTRDGRLRLDGLVTHCRPAAEAPEAYRMAFEDPACLKMVIDWRTCT
jgi:3-hydroxyethyl bacteriochlorophyllide a dehydrogenase